MEIVDYDKTKHWDIMIIKGSAERLLPDGVIQGYILRFVGESGKETRICCSPEELKRLGEACLDVTK
jgi:hypothetical protein